MDSTTPTHFRRNKLFNLTFLTSSSSSASLSWRVSLLALWSPASLHSYARKNKTPVRDGHFTSQHTKKCSCNYYTACLCLCVCMSACTKGHTLHINIHSQSNTMAHAYEMQRKTASSCFCSHMLVVCRAQRSGSNPQKSGIKLYFNILFNTFK